MKDPRTFKTLRNIRRLADEALKEHCNSEKSIALLRDAVWSLCGFIASQQAEINKLQAEARR